MERFLKLEDFLALRDRMIGIGSVGGKSRKVTLPSGLYPPEMVAVSFRVTPTTPPALGMVKIVGLALFTVEVSPASLQAPVTALLLASPE